MNYISGWVDNRIALEDDPTLVKNPDGGYTIKDKELIILDNNSWEKFNNDYLEIRDEWSNNTIDKETHRHVMKVYSKVKKDALDIVDWVEEWTVEDWYETERETISPEANEHAWKSAIN